MPEPSNRTEEVRPGEALDARCSQCGQPFRDHASHLDPTERGGFRVSMTCPEEDRA